MCINLEICKSAVAQWLSRPIPILGFLIPLEIFNAGAVDRGSGLAA